MKPFRFIAVCVLLLCASAFAEVLPPRPATQTEVNTGTDGVHPVTPKTLGGWSGGGGGGGASVPTNGFPGQVLELSTTGTIILTNAGAPLGYFTNAPVAIIMVGDSLTSGGQGDGRDYGYWLTNGLLNTNIALLPSNFFIATNAGIPGQMLTQMRTNITNILAAQSGLGSTNKLALVWGGINDAPTLSGYAAYTNAEEILGVCKRSNCVTVAFTIMTSTGINPGLLPEIDDFNERIRNGTNWDYLVDLAAAIPAPPDSDYYHDGTHLQSYYPVAKAIRKVLLRPRRSVFVPQIITPRPAGYFLGRATPYNGAFGLGADCVIAAMADLPIANFGTFGAQLYTVYPNNSAKQVAFYYNPAGSTWSPSTDLMMYFDRNTNVNFPKLVTFAGGIQSLTNSAVAPAAITFPATTVPWTNAFGMNIVLYIDNSAVTGTLVKKNGSQIFGVLQSDLSLMLKPGDYFSETYSSGTPTAKWEPQ